MYSSKFGKIAPLLPSNLNRFPFDAFDGEYQLFKDSLISSSSVHAKQVASELGRGDGAELPEVLVVPSPANTHLVPLPDKTAAVPSTHHINEVTYNSNTIKDTSTAQQRTLANIVEFLTQIQHVAIPSDAVVQRACLNAGAALPLELYDGLLQRPNIALRLLMLFLWRRTQHG